MAVLKPTTPPLKLAPVAKLTPKPRPEPDRHAKATAVEFLPDADEIERSPLPWMAQTTLHVLLALLVSFLLWATLSEVEKIVIAKGRLVTPLPNIVVQPLETSIIQSLNVRIGQIVKKGEVLATLDPTFTEADEAQLQNRLSSLDIQIQRLEAELSGGVPTDKRDKSADSMLQTLLSTERQANYKAQLTKMEETIARLNATLETNRRDQRALVPRVKLLQEIEAMQESLIAKQYGARVSLLEAQQKRLEVERDLQQAQNREAELKRELAAAEADRDAFRKGWRQKTMEDLLATMRERDSLGEELQKAEKRRNMVTLVSPADAVVLDIVKLSQGSVINTATPLFTLVPLAAPLEAEVQIDAVDIGYVKVGDVAHLKLDAYPFQRHGILAAKVRTLSEDAFRRDVAQQSGLDAYYLSRVDFGDSRLDKMPDGSRLLPGMTLAAEIVVGKRSVISYLLWPLSKALTESIREP